MLLFLISPTLPFIIAIAIGLSLEILLLDGSASLEPTILYSSISSSSTYLIFTVVPSDTLSVLPFFFYYMSILP